jgi:hypothetical protein
VGFRTDYINSNRKAVIQAYTEEEGLHPAEEMSLELSSMMTGGVEVSATLFDNLSLNTGVTHSLYTNEARFAYRDSTNNAFDGTSTSGFVSPIGDSRARFVAADVNVAGHLNRIEIFSFDLIFGYRANYFEVLQHRPDEVPMGLIQKNQSLERFTTTSTMPYIGTTTMFSFDFSQIKVWVLYSPFGSTVVREYGLVPGVERFLTTDSEQWLDYGLEFTARFRERFFTTLGFSGQFIAPSQGDVTFVADDGSSTTYPDIAKFEQSILATTITVGFVLGLEK